MEITFVVNGVDMSGILSTYGISYEMSYRKIIETLDGVLHPYPSKTRPVITFTVIPRTDAENATLFAALSSLIFPVTYTNTMGTDETRNFMLDSNIENLFQLKSVDGNRRYRGSEIVLRAIS